MTSLAPHYRDDQEALLEHLREEHAIFAALDTSRHRRKLFDGEVEAETANGSGVRRAHLCCADYRDGVSLKTALEAAAGGNRFVRTALNSAAHGGYCAVAHVSSAVATATAAAADGIGASCSPLTHASKEPLSLLVPSLESSSPRGGGGGDAAAAAAASPPFGLRLGPGVQDGRSRGLVVTLSPGSLPLGMASEKENTRGGDGGGGGVRNRPLSSSGQKSSSASAALERSWRGFWGAARGSKGAGLLATTVPWTDSAPHLVGGGGGSGDGRRSLLAVIDGGPGEGSEGQSGNRSRDIGGGSISRAREFHGQKVAGYKAALEHLGEKMERAREGGQRAATLAETCGWDRNLVFVHGRDDLLYLRCAGVEVRGWGCLVERCVGVAIIWHGVVCGTGGESMSGCWSLFCIRATREVPGAVRRNVVVSSRI